MSAFRIVVADDHVFVRRGIRTLLESRGWNVLAEASTGREAIERVEELKPDIVVLDISMPDLNGLDATPQILKIAPQTRVLKEGVEPRLFVDRRGGFQFHEPEFLRVPWR